MRSRYLPLLFLLPALLGAESACAPAEGLDAGSPVPDAGAFTTFRDPTQFFAGPLIDISAPARCEAITDPLQDLTFRWDATGQTRVFVGVFSTIPRASIDGAIENPADVVWAWMSGSGRADSGQLRWQQGFAPDSRGLPDLTTTAPTDLPRGFYWVATWAWDDQRRISHSSERRPFFWPGTGSTVLGPAECCEVKTDSNERLDFWCIPDEDPAVVTQPVECGLVDEDVDC